MPAPRPLSCPYRPPVHADPCTVATYVADQSATAWTDPSHATGFDLVEAHRRPPAGPSKASPERSLDLHQIAGLRRQHAPSTATRPRRAGERIDCRLAGSALLRLSSSRRTGNDQVKADDLITAGQRQLSKPQPETTGQSDHVARERHRGGARSPIGPAPLRRLVNTLRRRRNVWDGRERAAVDAWDSHDAPWSAVICATSLTEQCVAWGVRRDPVHARPTETWPVDSQPDRELSSGLSCISRSTASVSSVRSAAAACSNQRRASAVLPTPRSASA